MSTPRDIKAGVPQDSALSTLPVCKLYENDTPQTTDVNLALFADDTSLYATERRVPDTKADWPNDRRS
jgi:hypothetical protein